jgi:hypothetical protein
MLCQENPAHEFEAWVSFVLPGWSLEERYVICRNLVTAVKLLFESPSGSMVAEEIGQ